MPAIHARERSWGSLVVFYASLGRRKTATFSPIYSPHDNQLLPALKHPFTMKKLRSYRSQTEYRIETLRERFFARVELAKWNFHCHAQRWRIRKWRWILVRILVINIKLSKNISCGVFLLKDVRRQDVIPDNLTKFFCEAHRICPSENSHVGHH